MLFSPISVVSSSASCFIVKGLTILPPGCAFSMLISLSAWIIYYFYSRHRSEFGLHGSRAREGGLQSCKDWDCEPAHPQIDFSENLPRRSSHLAI